MNYKKVFLDSRIEERKIIEALKKGYITVDEIGDNVFFIEPVVKYLSSKGEHIPERFFENLSACKLVELYTETKNPQLKDRIKKLSTDETERLLYSYNVHVLSKVSEDDILESLAEKILQLSEFPVSRLRKDCPLLWEKIKLKRREMRKLAPRVKKQSTEPRYRHKLEEAIMKNDPSLYDSSHSKNYHKRLSNEEFKRLLPYWLKADPKLKIYLCETPQFNALPIKTQAEIINDCSLFVDIIEFKKICKDILQHLKVETVYNLLVRDTEYVHKQIITPELTEDEVGTILAPLCVAYPDKVSLLMKKYRLIRLMRKIFRNEPVEKTIWVDKQKEFFILASLDTIFNLYIKVEDVSLGERFDMLYEVLQIANPAIVKKVSEKLFSIAQYEHASFPALEYIR